jgi:cytochrome c-type biogenesis protein CcmH/NrfG
MAKSSAKEQAGKKNNALVYGIVILMTGALIGVAISTAFHSTKGQGEAPVQAQGGDMLGQIKIYSDRVALNPQDVNAWVTLGNLYFDTGQPAKSIEAYSRSLELSPDNANVLTDMGVMHRALGEFQKAVDTFAKAIAVDPRHETARMNTGIVLLYDLGDKECAIAAWQDLVRINPQAVNANGTPIANVLREMTGATQGEGGEQKLLGPKTNPAN